MQLGNECWECELALLLVGAIAVVSVLLGALGGALAWVAEFHDGYGG